VPLGVGTKVLEGDKETTIARRNRMMHQMHASLRGRSPGFATITGFTAADHILPGMLTPLMAGNNVIQGQLFKLFATILASVMIATEDLNASQLSHRAGTFDQSSEVNHRRNWQDAVHGVEIP